MKPNHNLRVGDIVCIQSQKTRAKVIKLAPEEHWPNCVLLDRELGGWKHWDAHELEKVDAKRR